jgi:hypothetical protein
MSAVSSSLLMRTGYGSALIRRITIENDLFAAVRELLQHKPKTVNGLRMQACACLLDPGFRWDAYPHMQRFLVSATEFGTPASAQGEEAARMNAPPNRRAVVGWALTAGAGQMRQPSRVIAIGLVGRQ